MQKIKGFTIKYLGITTIYSIIFLLIGFSLVLYKTIITKETRATITGVANSECMISAGTRGRSSTYGRKYHLKFNAGGREFKIVSSCSSPDYAVGETMKIRYNKSEPNIAVKNSDIDLYIIIAMFFGILMLSFGISPVSSEEKNERN